MKFLRSFSIAPLICFFGACVAPFQDDSRYVNLGSDHGFYLLRKGTPLALKLGYYYPPTSNTGDPGHRGYGRDVIAFRLNRAGVLSAPPAYFAQLGPESLYADPLGTLAVGSATWSDINRLFPGPKERYRQPDGGTVVFYGIDVYNALEYDGGAGG